MKLKTILGAAALAASSAALMSATPAFAEVDFFALSLAGPITSQTTETPYYCSESSACGTVTFTPTASFDELTLKDGAVYYFAPTAFTTFGSYSPLTAGAPPSSDYTAQFATVSVSGPALYTFADAAPEPASWALMIVGVGLAGGMLRYGRRQGAPSVA